MKLKILVIPLIIFAALAYPAAGAINTIPAGGTVFLGEQGLDITLGLGINNQIAWFPATASVTSATPEKIIDVTATKTAFYVNPIDFSSRTGNWYSWAAGSTVGTAPLAFRVDDPYLSIKVEDADAGVDVTNKWLYRGDEARFRIETNLYPIGQRVGVVPGGVPVTINFQTPDGAVLNALINKAGILNPLTDIPVATSPFLTGRLWDSLNPRYNPGTYTIWAECTANNMKENYPAGGKAISLKVTVLVQEQNPLISATTKPVTAAATTGGTTSAVTIPATTRTAPATIPATTAETPVPLPVTSPVTQTLPAPVPTRSDGFGFELALIAGIAGCILSCCCTRR